MKRKKISPKKGLNAALYISFWIFLLFVFSSAITMQYLEYRAYAREEAQLLYQIQVEAERTVSLEKNVDYYYSDAFVEKIAREELGLVREDEILFINDARR